MLHASPSFWNTSCCDKMHCTKCFNSGALLNSSSVLTSWSLGRIRLPWQISWIAICSKLHHIQPAFIPRRLQPNASRVHVFRHSQTPLWSTRASNLVDTAAYSSFSHDTAFLWTRSSRIRHRGQAFLRSLNACLLDMLPNHWRCMP